MSGRKGWDLLRSLLGKGFFSNLVYKDLNTREYDSTVQSLWTRIKTASGRRELSLDYLHDFQASKTLCEIAEGIFSLKSSYLDTFSQHMTYKTAWSILILGLGQKESVNRYMTLKAILIASAQICPTLVEESSKQLLIKTLLGTISGDERKENRLKGIYVLGKIGFYISSEPGHENLVVSTYRELASKLIQSQFEQRFNNALSNDARDSRIYLLSAMGKFVRVSSNNSSESSKYMDEIMFHVAREELSLNPNDKVIGKTILKILNTEINVTNKNKAVVGTLFLKNVNNLLKSEGDELHNEAVQFASLWLPVESELANLMSVNTQMSGLIEACELVPEFKEKVLEKELKELREQKEKEEAILSKKSSVFRQLLNPPGTSTKLESLSETPGFFVDTNSTLVYTSDIVVSLPIHPDSYVSVSRPLPPIPGVPPTATTVPTTIMDPTFASMLPAPCSKYEARERDGHVPGLPVGFSYAPGALVDKKDISPEYSSVPLSDDSDKSQVPKGFLKTCPNAAIAPLFNPSKYKNMSHQRSPISMENSQRKETFDEKGKIPVGFTAERHPILWPTTNPNLNGDLPESDFPVNAPVLFEIIEKGTKPMKFMTKVVSIDKEVSPILVESETGLFEKFGVGNTFSIYIRPRGKNSSWQSVNVEVVGGNYGEDVIKFARRDLDNGVLEPIPVGVTGKGEHFFAPPVNFPPVPIGYTEEGIPYYSKTQSVKPFPTIVTKGGKRFYASSRFKDASKIRQLQSQAIAGYDNYGQPFFVPSGCSIPPPVGYTEDGIPYYDIATIVRQKGLIQVVKKKTAMDMVSDPTDSSGESGIQSPEEEEIGEDGQPRVKSKGGPESEKERQDILGKVLSSLLESKPEVRKLIEQQEARALKNSKERSSAVGGLKKYGSDEMLGIEQLIKESDIDDHVPPDTAEAIMGLFQDIDLFDGNRGAKNMTMHFEPSKLEFQSVRTSVIKDLILKYAQPADGPEGYYYISTKPSEVFTCKKYQLNLQGSGEVALSVSYNPMAMRADRSEGVLNIIDDVGKKLSSVKLVALCQSFLKVHTKSLDFGWIMPNKSKEISFTIENVSLSNISIEIQVAASKNSSNPMLPPFHALEPFIDLHPGESKEITISYSPFAQGSHSYSLKIMAPGGETIEIGLIGYCGNPLVVFAEPDINDDVPPGELSRERTIFVKNLLKKIDQGVGAHQSNHHRPNAEEDDLVEEKLLKTIYYSGSHSSEDIDSAYTIDLGLIKKGSKHRKKITLLNMCTTSFTLAFFTRDEGIKMDEKTRVASKTANTMDVFIDTKYAKIDQGDFISCFEIMCPGFQNIPVIVKGYFGQPLFIPLWNFVSFKPVAQGQSDVIKTVLINQSQYPVSFWIKGVDKEIPALEKENRFNNQFFSSLSCDQGSPTVIKKHSSLPVTFKFKAGRRGPLLSKLTCVIMSPVCKFEKANANEMELCAFGQPFHLMGVCIHPHASNSDGVNFNNIDFIRSWSSSPARLIEDYPKTTELMESLFNSSDIMSGTSESSSGNPINNGGISFKFDTLNFRPQVAIRSAQKPQILNSLIQNRRSEPVRCDFVSSCCFSVDPASRNLLGNDTGNFEVIYTSPAGGNSPDFGTVYGFVIGSSDLDNSLTVTQTIARNRVDFIVCPATRTVDDEIVIDFGHVENTSPVLKSNSRTITLCNTGNNSLSWSLKFSNSKTLIFEPNKSSGDLGPGEYWPLNISFMVRAHGFYEATAEIFVRDAGDRNSKPQKAGTILMRGEHIPFVLSGAPESIDFGHLLINRPKSIEFILSNKGTKSCNVTAVSKDPFDVAPKSSALDPEMDQPFLVSFSPIESKSFSSKLQLFSGNVNQTIDLFGIGGTCALSCDQFENNSIDFGQYRMGSSVFVDVYLMNKGSLPVRINAISGKDPSMVCVYFMQIVAGAEAENSSFRSKSKISMVKVDFWKVVRKRLSSVLALSMLPKKATVLQSTRDSVMAAARPARGERGGFLAKRITTFNLASSKSPILVLEEEQQSGSPFPELKPMYSYHFRVGLCSESQSKKATSLNFHYVPRLDEPDEDLNELQSRVSLDLKGVVFFPLEFFPPYHDFGLAPAESNFSESAREGGHLGSNSYGVAKTSGGGLSSSNLLYISITNRSKDAQSLSLKSISKGFYSKERSWMIEAGQILSIPIEFHPVKAQTQYRGEVSFVHDHGEHSILLIGTGASADLIVDNKVDFGKAIIQKKVSKFLTLTNRGYLSSKFLLQLVQTGNNDYRFINDDPNEIDGVLESGSSRKIEIECHVRKNYIPPAYALFRFQTIADGPWEEINVPFEIAVGVPNFQVSNPIIDFGTTFLSNRKSISVELLNNGTAECQWHLKGDDTPFLRIEPKSGILVEGSSSTLEISFQPVDYNPLNHVLYFETDVGIRTLSCVGIVGVPYLKIDEADAMVDFGIIEVNKIHSKSISVLNTAPKFLEFFAGVMKGFSNEKEIPDTLFDQFFMEDESSSHGQIPPKTSINVVFSARPRDYGVRISATYFIKTSEGEEVYGSLAFTGGQAIINVDHKDPSLARHKVNVSSLRLTLSNHVLLIQQISSQLQECSLIPDAISEFSGLSSILRPPSGSAAAKGEANSGRSSPSHFESEDDPLGTYLMNLLNHFNKTLEDLSKKPDYEIVAIEKLDHLEKTKFNACNQLVGVIRNVVIDLKEEDTVTLNQLDESTNAFHELNKPIDTVPEYDLGLMRPGVNSEKRKILECRNTGNMDASMKLRRVVEKDVIPVEALNNRAKAGKNYFSITPPEFSLSTGSNVAAYACLMGANDPGSYSVTYEIVSLPDKLIDQFRVVGRIGKTMLSWTPSTINFGLLPRKNSKTQTVTLENIGEFEESYAIAEITEPNTPFELVLSSNSGTLQPGQSISFNINFFPVSVGHFQSNIPVKWWNGARNSQLTLVGDCGSPEIHISSVDDSGQEFKDADLFVDFGNSFIGTTASRAITLTNTGKCAGELDFYLPSAQLLLYEISRVQVVEGAEPVLDSETAQTATLDVGKFLPASARRSSIIVPYEIKVIKKNTEGRKLIIEPGDTLNLLLELTCERKEAIDGSIVIGVKDYDKINIPVSAMVGKPSYEAKGELQYFNMSLEDEQVQFIEIINNGDFALPFDIDLTTGTSHPDAFSVKFSFFKTNIVNDPVASANISDFVPESLSGLLKTDETLRVAVFARPKVSIHHTVRFAIDFASDFLLDPFSSECTFRAYDQQLQLNNTADETVEKLDTGSEYVFKREIGNLGSHPITIRLKLEFPGMATQLANASFAASKKLNATKSIEDIKASTDELGKGASKKASKKKKKADDTTSDSTASPTQTLSAIASPSPVPSSAGIESTLFSLCEGSELTIPGDGTSFILVKYQANDTSDDILREARVVIEFPGKVADTWKEFAKYSLFASTCRPRIEVLPLDMDFDHICLGASKTKTFTIENQGSGNVKYLVRPVKETSIFVIEPAEALNGEIHPKDVLTFQLTFKPEEIGDFSLSVEVSTAFQKEVIEIFGKGAVLRLKKEQIPKELNFGELLFGQDKEIHFSVSNDCEIPLTVGCRLLGSDPVYTHPEITFDPSSSFHLPVILPARDKKGRLLKQQGPPPPNGGEQLISVRKFMPYPRLDETNPESEADVAALEKCIGVISNSYSFKIEIEGGDQYEIPIQFSVKALSVEVLTVDQNSGQIINQQQQGSSGSPLNEIEKIDFGQMNFFDTKSFKFAVRNPNNAPVKIDVSKSHKQVTIEPMDCFISACGAKLFTVTILAMALDEVGIPRNEVQDTITINQNLVRAEEFKIPVSGVQTDLPINPEEILRPIIFEDAYLQRTRVKSFHWINSTSLPKKYTATMTADPSKAFSFDPAAVLSGEVPVKGALDIPILFQPVSPLSYEAFMKLVIDTHEFSIQMTGVGLNYSVSLKPESLDLGTIDAERDNTFEVLLSNDSNIDLEDVYIESDVAMIVNPDRISLLPALSKKTVSCVLKGTGPKDTSLIGKEFTKKMAVFIKVASETIRLSGTSIRAYGGHQSFSLCDLGPDNKVHYATPFSEGKTQKMTVGIENTGDTKLVIEILDEQGERLSSHKSFFGDDDLAIAFNPYDISLMSGQKKSFTVSVHGEKAGTFEKVFTLQSKGVVPPISVPIVISGFIESNAALDGLRAFIKNDRSLDYILNVENAPENNYASDDLIWKLMKPIVRVSKARLLDSVFKVIPAMKPIVSEIDISAFTVRPPALPKDLENAQQTRWFINRQSLRMEKPMGQGGKKNAIDPNVAKLVANAPEPIRQKLLAAGERRYEAETYYKGKEKGFATQKNSRK